MEKLFEDKKEFEMRRWPKCRACMLPVEVEEGCYRVGPFTYHVECWGHERAEAAKEMIKRGVV